MNVRYGRIAIALHWGIALVLLYQVAWGWAMQSVPPLPAGPRAAAFNLHKSIGLMLLAAMALRFAWRLRHPPPPLPALPPWQRAAAHANHLFLYGVLIALAVVGYLGSVFSGYPVKLFGWALPAWGWKDAALKEGLSRAHFLLSWLLAAGVGLHLLAVASHAWNGHRDVLGRMLPARRRLALRD